MRRFVQCVLWDSIPHSASLVTLPYNFGAHAGMQKTETGLQTDFLNTEQPTESERLKP